MALTTEDRLDLHELYSRYAFAFDGGDGDTWCELFAPDGSFVLPDGTTISGTETLRDFVNTRASEAPGMRHLMTNISLDESGDGATGRAYFLCFRLAGDDQFRLLNFGRYDDEFVRADGGWRIASRTVVAELPLALRDLPLAFTG